ncbi:hypothetical protein CPB83DRAFT_896247 [Crepidotus variabilis]|uniref:Uncharacterized protein n=1 Tax=Crepidotus variabilis TaxID=179855 RepID=A0A9P6JN41_9AGAR|nr:hypothetical protein CPB83DRAFT_896247 [Crepidotus variabilis]
MPLAPPLPLVFPCVNFKDSTRQLYHRLRLLFSVHSSTSQATVEGPAFSLEEPTSTSRSKDSYSQVYHASNSLALQSRYTEQRTSAIHFAPLSPSVSVLSIDSNPFALEVVEHLGFIKQSGSIRPLPNGFNCTTHSSLETFTAAELTDETTEGHPIADLPGSLSPAGRTVLDSGVCLSPILPWDDLDSSIQPLSDILPPRYDKIIRKDQR